MADFHGGIASCIEGRGWSLHLRPGPWGRSCALRLPPGDRLCSPSPPRWAWRPCDTAEPAMPDRPSRLRRCALRLRGVGVKGARCLFSCLSFPHHLVRDRSTHGGAVKARQAVSSPLAAGRTTPSASSLTAPPRALLWPRAMNSGKTVATKPTGFFVPTPPEARRGL
jgi:hypothetical protein